MKRYIVRVYEGGLEEWWHEQNLHIHRENGPAVTNPDGTKEYWLYGKKYLNKEQWQKKLEMEKSKKELKVYLKKMLSYLEEN